MNNIPVGGRSSETLLHPIDINNKKKNNRAIMTDVNDNPIFIP
jgi:hypothetical protein